MGGDHFLYGYPTHCNELIIWKILNLRKKLGTNPLFFTLSISFMVIVAQSFLCIRRFWLYGNQPCSEIHFLMDSTSDNEFTQALLISGIISVVISSISPIIWSIWCVSISCFTLRRLVFMFSSVLLILLPDTMMCHTEHQKPRSICDFHQICISKNPDQNNYYVHQTTVTE